MINLKHCRVVQPHAKPHQARFNPLLPLDAVLFPINLNCVTYTLAIALCDSSALMGCENHDVKDTGDLYDDAYDELPLADKCSHGCHCHC